MNSCARLYTVFCLLLFLNIETVPTKTSKVMCNHLTIRQWYKMRISSSIALRHQLLLLFLQWISSDRGILPRGMLLTQKCLLAFNKRFLRCTLKRMNLNSYNAGIFSFATGQQWIMFLYSLPFLYLYTYMYMYRIFRAVRRTNHYFLFQLYNKQWPIYRSCRIIV